MSINIGNAKIDPSFGGLTSTTGSVIPTDNSAYYVGTPINSGGYGSGGSPGYTITTTGGMGPYTYEMATPSEVQNILKDFIDKVRALPQDKLDSIGVVFKKSLARYKAWDKALNITREIGFYTDLVDSQEALWDEIAPKVGYKNYSVRDAIWDAMIAQLIKNDLTQKEFITLTTPYGVTLISER